MVKQGMANLESYRSDIGYRYLQYLIRVIKRCDTTEQLEIAFTWACGRVAVFETVPRYRDRLLSKISIHKNIQHRKLDLRSSGFVW